MEERDWLLKFCVVRLKGTQRPLRRDANTNAMRFRHRRLRL